MLLHTHTHTSAKVWWAQATCHDAFDRLYMIGGYVRKNGDSSLNFRITACQTQGYECISDMVDVLSANALKTMADR